MTFIKSKFAVAILILISLFISNAVSSEPVSIKLDKLTLNANIEAAEDKSAPYFLILHGTFAWYGMELPTSIQSLLKEEDYGSLSITLSLNEDNRSGFFDCSHLISSKHEDAQHEISAWINYLKQQGYTNINLIGHSRGGAQIAQYGLTHSSQISKMFLIAPMTWNSDNAAKIKARLKSAKKESSQVLKNIPALHCSNASITGDAYLSYYAERPIKDTPTLIANVKIPTKVYLGEQDLTITNSFKANQKIFDKNHLVSKILIEDADHYFRDFAAEDIVTDIIETVEN